jgi:prolyl-tRNA editing enzyme YbaK/EbsC (Cys-tRNA(Pro) deacylase)
MKPAAERVQAALSDLGFARSVLELPVDARTSQQAADALGVAVGAIVKSLVFLVDDRPVLVVASGANRVDESRLGRLAGGTVRRADAETVRRVTGYAIGGVPPFAHASPLTTYVDRDLIRYDLVYAAAGTPDCVFPLTPDELVRGTTGTVEDLKALTRAPAEG